MVPYLKTVEAHGDGTVELLEQFGVLGAPAEPGHALLLGCADHVHGGARRGDVLHACGQVDLRGVIEYELEGAGETWRAGLVRSSFTLLVRLPPLRIVRRSGSG